MSCGSVARKINLAAGISGELERIWRTKEISHEIKVILYMVQSAVIYKLALDIKRRTQLEVACV